MLGSQEIFERRVRKCFGTHSEINNRASRGIPSTNFIISQAIGDGRSATFICLEIFSWFMAVSHLSLVSYWGSWIALMVDSMASNSIFTKVLVKLFSRSLHFSFLSSIIAHSLWDTLLSGFNSFYFLSYLDTGTDIIGEWKTSFSKVFIGAVFIEDLSLFLASYGCFLDQLALLACMPLRTHLCFRP